MPLVNVVIEDIEGPNENADVILRLPARKFLEITKERGSNYIKLPRGVCLLFWEGGVVRPSPTFSIPGFVGLATGPRYSC